MFSVSAVSYSYADIAADLYLVVDQPSGLVDDVQRVQRRHLNSMPVKYVKSLSSLSCTANTVCTVLTALMTLRQKSGSLAQ